MGVKSLWPVLECTGETVDLKGLAGSVIAIDLAGWVVSNAQCRAMTGGRVAKPHLRNVFFRTTALLDLGIKPVFVLDGAAPEIKRDTLTQRKAAEFSSQSSQTSQSTVEVKSLTRTRLKALMNECKFLLSAMGIQCIQAKGEGESLCAQLNREGLVDGVISDDSDVFCYGARSVFRNFSVSAKAFSAEHFSIAKLEEKLGLSRDRLMLMAVLLGCDYFPSGVPGVGKETVMQLFNGWPRKWNALNMLNFWKRSEFSGWSGCVGKTCVYSSSDEDRHCSLCQLWKDCLVSFDDSDCLCDFLRKNKSVLKLETAVKKRCLKVDPNWWNEECPKILKEFHTQEESPPDMEDYKRHQCPKFSQCISILVKKLLWTEEYALEKLIPLVSRWQLEHLASGGTKEVARVFEIVKKRIVAGIPSLCIRWNVLHTDAAEIQGLPRTFESCDATALVESAYPDLYEEFLIITQKPKNVKKKAPAGRGKSKVIASTQGEHQEPITKFFSQKKVGPLQGQSANSVSKEAPRAKRNLAFHTDNKPREIAPKTPQAPITANNELDWGESFHESSMDCSNLSDIIDDIISKKVTDMSVDEPDEQEEKPLLTSTPAGAVGNAKVGRAARNNSLRKKAINVFSQYRREQRKLLNKENEVWAGQSDDELEDTFDRMCK